VFIWEDFYGGTVGIFSAILLVSLMILLKNYLSDGLYKNMGSNCFDGSNAQFYVLYDEVCK
jgi:hypothetical protein